jgi:hypothetical protein
MRNIAFLDFQYTDAPVLLWDAVLHPNNAINSQMRQGFLRMLLTATELMGMPIREDDVEPLPASHS